MGKKKIAVLLFGLLRHWEQCSTIFSYWNNLYNDLEFDFYLTTWEFTDQYPTEKGHISQLMDNSKLSLKQVKLHNQDEPRSLTSGPIKSFYFSQESETKKSRYVPSYCYLKSSVCKLVDDSKIEYDAAIITRPDVFVFIETLETLRKSIGLPTVLLNDKSCPNLELGHNIIYNSDSPKYKENGLFIDKDTLWFGKLDVVLKFKHIFNDAFVDYRFPAHRLHTIQPEFLLQRKIFSGSARFMSNVLVRTEEVSKGILPTPEVLDKLITEYGKDLYTLSSKHLTSVIFRERNV